MSEIPVQDLSGVTETLLIPLSIRALEAQRPDAILKDDRAAAVVQQLGYDPTQVLARVDEESWIGALLRSREFDRRTRDFLAAWPDAVVVHIGCGLDTRFERVDNGTVDWYDLDLPEVIELRRKLIGDEGPRQRLLACSVLDNAWLETISVHRLRPFLFLAEGVFMYLEEAQIKALVLTLLDRFPGTELVFDAFSPFFVWAANLRVALTHVGARCAWALKRGKDLEGWSDGGRPPHDAQRGAGVRLLDEWFVFTSSEPRLLQAARLARAPWVARIPLFANSWGVFHYQLGSPTDRRNQNRNYLPVIPAKAGIHLESLHWPQSGWIPAFAGMTGK